MAFIIRSHVVLACAILVAAAAPAAEVTSFRCTSDSCELHIQSSIHASPQAAYEDVRNGIVHFIADYYHCTTGEAARVYGALLAQVETVAVHALHESPRPAWTHYQVRSTLTAKKRDVQKIVGSVVEGRHGRVRLCLLCAVAVPAILLLGVFEYRYLDDVTLGDCQTLVVVIVILTLASVAGLPLLAL